MKRDRKINIPFLHSIVILSLVLSWLNRDTTDDYLGIAKRNLYKWNFVCSLIILYGSDRKREKSSLHFNYYKCGTVMLDLSNDLNLFLDAKIKSGKYLC